MAINFGNSFITIDKRWQFFITASLNKGLAVQYEEDVGFYTIFSIDNNIVYFTNIWKGSLPSIGDYSQAQNDGDKGDFEVNYKSGSNKPTTPWSTPTNTQYASASSTSIMIGGRDGSNNLLPFAAHYNGTQVNEPHGFAVARGRFANEFNFWQPAYVGTPSNAATVVRATAYIEDTIGSQRSLVSTNAADAAAGTGARTIRLRYFKNDGTGPFAETVTMNGTTPVNTSGTNIRFIESMEAVTVGSNGGNVGSINLKQNTGGGGSTLAQIAVSDNRTFLGHHYVGTNHKGGLVRMLFGCTGNNYSVNLRKIYPLVSNSAEVAVLPTFRVINAQPTQQFHFDQEPIPVDGFAKYTFYCQADTVLIAGTLYADMAFDEVDLS